MRACTVSSSNRRSEPLAAHDVLMLRLGSLGDVVLAGAAGQALAAARPDLKITFLVKGEYAELVRGQPWAHEVWALAPGEERSPLGLAGWRRRIRSGAFGAIVDLQTSPRSRALLSGQSHVFAWRAARWPRRRWVSLRWTQPGPVRPAWLRFVDALAPLGVDPALALPPQFVLSTSAQETAAAWAAAWGGGPIVLFAPGARWATKRWPQTSYLALGRALVGAKFRVLMSGDEADRAALPLLAGWAGGDPRARWFEGSLVELAATAALAQAAVTNDTGLMHLAAAVGVPVVALFGSTHPALGFAPAGAGHQVLCAGLACQPCTLHGLARCPLGHHRCMRQWTPEAVLAAVSGLLPGAAGVRIDGEEH